MLKRSIVILCLCLLGACSNATTTPTAIPATATTATTATIVVTAAATRAATAVATVQVAPATQSSAIANTAPEHQIAAARIFTGLPISKIPYEATLTVGGLKVNGNFRGTGYTTAIPVAGGYQVQINLIIDGNSVTAPDTFILALLKGSLETIKFPFAYFNATSQAVLTLSATPVTVTMSGTLTLHGVTNPISMPITFTLADGRLTETGSTEFDLTTYGVNVPTALMKSVIKFSSNFLSAESF